MFKKLWCLVVWVLLLLTSAVLVTPVTAGGTGGSGKLRVLSPDGIPVTGIGTVFILNWPDYKGTTASLWVNITVVGSSFHFYDVLFNIAANGNPNDNFTLIEVEKNPAYGASGSPIATYSYDPADFVEDDWAPAYGPPMGGFYGGGSPSKVWVLPAKSAPP